MINRRVQDMHYATIDEVTGEGASARRSQEPDDVSPIMSVAHGVPQVGGACVIVEFHGSSFLIPISEDPPTGSGSATDPSGLRGPAGARGLPGHTGADGPPGHIGHDGARGLEGAQGRVGTGIIVKGTVATVHDLQAVPHPVDGEVHYVAKDGDLHIFHHPCNAALHPTSSWIEENLSTTSDSVTGVTEVRLAASASSVIGRWQAAFPVHSHEPIEYSADVRVFGIASCDVEFQTHPDNVVGAQHSVPADSAWHTIQGEETTGADTTANLQFVIESNDPHAYVEVRNVLVVHDTPGGAVTGADGCWADLGHVEGPQGPRGVIGQRGLPGADGHRGTTGAPGHTGQTGPPGPRGEIGARGPAGSRGEIGAAGRSVKITKSHTAPSGPALGDIWVSV